MFPEAEGRIKFIENDGNSSSVTPTSPVENSTPANTGSPIVVHKCASIEANSATVSNSKMSLIFFGHWFIYIHLL